MAAPPAGCAIIAEPSCCTAPPINVLKKSNSSCWITAGNNCPTIGLTKSKIEFCNWDKTEIIDVAPEDIAPAILFALSASLFLDVLCCFEPPEILSKRLLTKLSRLVPNNFNTPSWIFSNESFKESVIILTILSFKLVKISVVWEINCLDKSVAISTICCMTSPGFPIESINWLNDSIVVSIPDPVLLLGDCCSEIVLDGLNLSTEFCCSASVFKLFLSIFFESLFSKLLAIVAIKLDKPINWSNSLSPIFFNSSVDPLEEVLVAPLLFCSVLDSSGNNPFNVLLISLISSKIPTKLLLTVSNPLATWLNLSLANSDNGPKSISSSLPEVSKDLADDLSGDCCVPESCTNCSLSTPILSL